jgi:hypothetical protein
MKMIKLACALSVGAVLSACGVADVVTRSTPFEPQTPTPAIAFTQNDVTSVKQAGIKRTVRTISAEQQAPRTILPAAILRQINVARINVSVPTSLKVSEANRYYPRGDIVWREDPMGNRHAQVSKIVHDAMTTGTSTFQGPVPVFLDIEVVRFHALSEKARYTVGGDHHIVFKMVLRDATSGEFLSESRLISTDLDAFGGQQAISAEARGFTQKVRISGHLAEVIRQQMTEPEGFKNASFGFYQLVNRI